MKTGYVWRKCPAAVMALFCAISCAGAFAQPEQQVPQGGTGQAAAPKPQEKPGEDWPNLGRYKDADAKLPPPAEGENRVVFMGDSITDFWIGNSPDFFAANHYIDRGISGQTAPQMLLRFRADVIELKPKAVLILAGTNDIAQNTGFESMETITGYLASMAELARANGIVPVLCSVLPAADFWWRRGLEPAPKIAALNAMIKDYALKNKIVYADYYQPMADGKLGLKAELAPDGVHPNKAGYAVMEPIAQKAIAEALLRK